MRLLELFLVEYKRDITIQKLGDKLEQAAQRERNQTGEAVLTFFEQIDPTKNKQYVEWLCRQYIKSMFRVEDGPRIRKVLTQFENAKRTNQPVERDINRYDFRTLRDAMDKLYNTEIDGEKTSGTFPVVPDTEVLYNGPLGQLAIPKTEEASKILGKKTKWCTAWDEDNRFEFYNNYGTIYTWRGTDGSRYQFHYDAENSDISAMDGKDDPIAPQVLQSLRTTHPVLSKFLQTTFEPMIAKSAESSIEYAINFLHGPFLAGERAILMAGEDSIKLYMNEIYDGRGFPAYEEWMIDHDSFTEALRYCTVYRKKPWPEFEHAILEHEPTASVAYIAAQYALHVMFRRWPEAEKLIASYPLSAYKYTNDVIRGKWPEAEPVMAANPETALRYAAEIIHGPWPEGELAISTSPWCSVEYVRTIIKDRWPPGEPAMKSSTREWNRYVTLMAAKGIHV